MITRQPLSTLLQDIAELGLRREEADSSGVGACFELLLFLAWQAWNESISGPAARAPNWRKAATEICTRLGITPADRARLLVSTDFETLIGRMVAKKQAHFSGDDRLIHAVEKTPSGHLRVHAAPARQFSPN